MKTKSNNTIKKRLMKRKSWQSKTSDDKKNVEIQGGFTIIKDVLPPKKLKAKRVLPNWLLNPTPIQRSLRKTEVSPKEVCPNLHVKIVKKLKENNILYFFPVQQVVVPQVLMGAHGMESRFRPRDICVATPTGSGKTLAFVLPIVQAICKRSIPAIKALVILPVTELAKQVYKVFQTYAAIFKLNVGQAFGQESFFTEQKHLVGRVCDQYVSDIDILVATPGRLLDHITKTPGLDFSQLRFLVLDEADKLLAGESAEQISRIQRHLMKFKHQPTNLGLPPFFPIKDSSQQDLQMPTPSDNSLPLNDYKLEKGSFISRSFERGDKNCAESKVDKEFFLVHSIPLQRLLFSATLSHDPEQLQNISLYRPMLFTIDCDDKGSKPSDMDITKAVRPAELTEEWVLADLSLKPLLLHYILKKEKKKVENFKALVFAGSLELTYKITVLLRKLSKGKYSVSSFNSKIKKEQKLRMNEFMTGKINVLVSSDAMARGMDVPDVDCVVSYDVPSANTYVHRVGRTARAGKPGKAISIVSQEEFKDLKKILGSNFDATAERIVSKEKLAKFDTSFKLALKSLSVAVNAKNHKGKRKIPQTMKRKKAFTKKVK